jgi:anti-sigma factor RsiW
MNACHEMEERLNDHVEEQLPLPEQREVEKHLASCSGCREVLEGLRSLRKQTEELPHDIQPPRDLWPGIAAELEGARNVTPLRPRTVSRPSSIWRVALPAAAALLLVALTALVTARLVGPEAQRPDDVLGTGLTSLQAFRAAEADYRNTTDDLMAALDQRRGELSPETIEVVEENLRIINEAIHEAWTALESEPSRVGNGYLVASLYQKKLELLEQAIRLPAES